MKKLILLLLPSICALAIAAPAGRADNPSFSAGVVGKSVVISNFQFAPRSVTIKAGATITWTNQEGTHTVTADDNSWESPTLNAGKTFSRQFTKPGTYPYHCSFHGSPGADMSGVVTVVR